MEVQAKYFDDKPILRILFATHSRIKSAKKPQGYRDWAVRLKENGADTPPSERVVTVTQSYMQQTTNPAQNERG
jgi:hypothetical protein